MRIFYNNLIDADEVTITESSEVATLPAENVQNTFRSKVWRTGSSVANESITFDLQTAQTISAVILLNHTLTASDTDIKLQGSSDNFSTVHYEETLTHASGTIHKTFSDQSYRYWRVIFTKSSAGESRDIGRIFIGDHYSAPEQPDFDGLEEQSNDSSINQRTLGGQIYSDIKSEFGTLELSFSQISNAQAKQFHSIAKSVGIHQSIFVQVEDSGASSDPFDKVWYVKFSDLSSKNVDGIDDSSELAWNMTLEFEEQL